MQAGIIEEMLEDTFEVLEDDDLEEAAQEEVDKILFEVTKGHIFCFCILIYSFIMQKGHVQYCGELRA